MSWRTDISHRDLTHRTALVTGSASGIGKAIATMLRASGAELVLVDLASDALTSIGKELSATTFPADLSRRDEVDSLTHAVGHIDILVNNAGLQHVSPIHEFPLDDWDLILTVMLTAPFLLARALLPSMYAQDWGRIINIASVHGLRASANKSAYVAAKHGLVGLTKTIGLEASEHARDVTAHAICPSYVRTPMMENQIAAQAVLTGLPVDQVLEQVLLTRNAVKRLISPEEVAEAVEFLCGESAWTMTGSTLTLDAGWLSH